MYENFYENLRHFIQVQVGSIKQQNFITKIETYLITRVLRQSVLRLHNNKLGNGIKYSESRF